MATATFDKRIIIDQNDADFLVRELEKPPVGPPRIDASLKSENDKEVDKWLSSYGSEGF